MDDRYVTIKCLVQAGIKICEAELLSTMSFLMNWAYWVYINSLTTDHPRKNYKFINFMGWGLIQTHLEMQMVLKSVEIKMSYKISIYLLKSYT